MYSEDELLPISALQHMAFCERQAALIHIENSWYENVLTAEGRLLHEKSHSEEMETVGNIRISRGLRLRSLELGLIGIADVVEFHHRADAPAEKTDSIQIPGLRGWWKPYIVEYKHGSPKLDRIGEVQLCAQAICLEEMLAVTIPSSAFYYGKPRRRHVTDLNKELREETRCLALRLHEMIGKGQTPAAIYTHKCRSCSLLDNCMPKVSQSTQRVSMYLHKAINEEII